MIVFCAEVVMLYFEVITFLLSVSIVRDFVMIILYNPDVVICYAV